MSARKIKRIVLSDEEDGNDADCDEITESASAKKLAESINQLNVLDSAEKISNNKSSRKIPSEEARPKAYAVDGSKQLFYQRGSSHNSEESDGPKRPNSSINSSSANVSDGRRVSARSQTVTSKKENSRQKALTEMKNIRSRGLDAINFDESDEDAYSEVYDDESEEEEEEVVLPRKSTKKPTDSKKVDYEYSYAPKRSSSNGGGVNRLGPSAHTLKMFSEYRGNHEKEHDTYASDLDDFIVREEEEEDEGEEAEGEESTDDDADGEVEFGAPEGAVASQSPVKKKKGSRSKVIAVDEDEEDEEDAPQVSKSTKSRRVRRVLFGSDSEGETPADTEEDRRAAKSKKKSKQKRKREQTENDEDDGPMLYWQVNAKMDEEMDDDPDELNAATAGHLFQMRQVSMNVLKVFHTW